MKFAAWYAALAVLLFLIGESLWAHGKAEQKLANAERQVITFHYAAPMRDYDSIENSSRYMRGLPWTSDLLRELRNLRATSQYWQGNYSALDVPRDSSGAAVEDDPRILFLAANAEYRSAKLKPGEPETEKQLNQISESYGEVLKRDSENEDAAYNYEFVARLRETLAKAATAQPTSKTEAAVPVTPKRPVVTIDGRQGAPPQVNVTPFKTVVPKNGDERKQDEEAGKGTKKVRKG